MRRGLAQCLPASGRKALRASITRCEDSWQLPNKNKQKRMQLTTSHLSLSNVSVGRLGAHAQALHGAANYPAGPIPTRTHNARAKSQSSNFPRVGLIVSLLNRPKSCCPSFNHAAGLQLGASCPPETPTPTPAPPFLWTSQMPASSRSTGTVPISSTCQAAIHPRSVGKIGPTKGQEAPKS